MKSKSGEILAIAVQPLKHMTDGRARFPDLPCQLAVDPDCKAITALDLINKVGVKTMAVPSNILVDRHGFVRWTHYASLVSDRPGPTDVLIAVTKVLENN